MPFISLIVDKKYKQVFWLPFVYLYSLTWLPITLIGFIKRNQKVWVHTQHTRRMTDVGFEIKTNKDEHSA
ncbi:hypothetical protein [Virgibacillus oceani]|uniref:Uncharacterized protein n=1 Tax=Virgibacillus oceani TaxID=1479511 RepID=A0A917M3N8_9BACI|nr:hypothetical protein [Virgibacillus oceani]GGG73282.1 hypothetical protein GCM10011398_17130 [Virgibacillus oceani]